MPAWEFSSRPCRNRPTWSANFPLTGRLIEYVVGPRQIAIFVLRHDGLHAMLEPVRSVDLESKITLLRDLIRRPDSTDWQLPAAELASPAGRTDRKSRMAARSQRDHNRPPRFPPLSYRLRRWYGLLARVIDSLSKTTWFPTCQWPAALAMSSPPQRHQASALWRLLHQFPTCNSRPARYELLPLPLGAMRLPSLVRRRLRRGSSVRAGDYDVIHFATHGFFNKANPLFSGVQLEPDTQNDGRLEVYEILGLHLRAQLVTLSACETALGSGYFTEIPAGR